MMKKEIPILFSTPMVQAIMEGRKTQTRRVVKPQIDLHGKWGEGVPQDDPNHFCVHGRFNGADKWLRCPYGKPGDLLWVRESFATIFEGFEYKADDGRMIAGVQNINLNDKYKPSIHMPKAAARIWLQVVSVKVERLQEISANDAMSEGVANWASSFNGDKYADIWRGNTDNKPYPVQAFRKLWQSINGAESWDSNPWCWVVEFKKAEKP